eukprot:gene41424-50544_t
MAEFEEVVTEKVQEGILNAAIEEDMQFVERCLPEAAIVTLSKDYITVLIIRTPYSRIQLRATYVTNYPAEPPLVELSSPTLPPPLLRTKEKECMEKARELAGKAQFQMIYDLMHQFVHTNLFVPCWREMKQVAALCEGKGQLGADEKEGVLQLRLHCDAYKLNVRLRVPALYPEEGVRVEVGSCNFPADIQLAFFAQADEIVRRCEAGVSPEQAAQMSGGVNLPPRAAGGPAPVRLT